MSIHQRAGILAVVILASSMVMMLLFLPATLLFSGAVRSCNTQSTYEDTVFEGDLAKLGFTCNLLTANSRSITADGRYSMTHEETAAGFALSWVILAGSIGSGVFAGYKVYQQLSEN